MVKKIRFNSLGVATPVALLPHEDIDMESYAVIACDQHTSEPEYWEKVEELAKDKISTAHLILPEVYLNTPDEKERIEKIQNTMNQYINDKVFNPRWKESDGFIYVKRHTKNGIRHGIVLCVDLEFYDFSKDSKSQIRASEATIVERIEPRLKIRRNASLELPHIMLLVNDKDDSVFAGVKSMKLDKFYDFELMLDGGRIEGYEATGEAMYSVTDALKVIQSAQPILFAVGDGNHSLATAKQHYIELKEKFGEELLKDHPLRYAMVEVVNIYDEALKFEPIHRLLYGENQKDMIDKIIGEINKTGAKAAFAKEKNPAAQNIEVVGAELNGFINIENPAHTLPVGSLQNAINEIVNDKLQVDYIHGDDTLKDLVRGNDKSVGFLLPAMDKSLLFESIEKDGPLPRKTFSMGDANEKRYYVEARKITM